MTPHDDSGEPAPSEDPPGGHENPLANFRELEPVNLDGTICLAIDERSQQAVQILLLSDLEAGDRSRLLERSRQAAGLSRHDLPRLLQDGVDATVPILVLEHRDWEPLRSSRTRLGRESLLTILSQVARTLHELHAIGLVHGGLSIDSIIVRANDGQPPEFFIHDLVGWELDPNVERLRCTAPEVLERSAEARTRRSDIYALGALGFELITGAPYVLGQTTQEVMRAALLQESRSLAEVLPGVPRSLELVIHKCLEERPEDRYPTLRAVAEDLDRYLSGGAVRADRSLLSFKIVDAIRRHRLNLVSGTAVSLAVGSFLIGLAAEADSTARLERTMTQLAPGIERVESAARAAYLLPADARAKSRTRLESIYAQLEAQAHHLDPRDEGPRDYSLGRASLALGREERAIQLLRGAWSDGLRHPALAHALGRALSATTLSSRVDRHLGVSAEPSDRSRGEAVAAFLIRGQKEAQVPPVLSKALVAANLEQYEEAIDLCQQALVDYPWLFEAAELEAELTLLDGIRSRSNPDTTIIRRAVEAALEARSLAPSAPEADARVCRAFAILLDAHLDPSTEEAGKDLLWAKRHCSTEAFGPSASRRDTEALLEHRRAIAAFELDLGRSPSAWTVTRSRLEGDRESSIEPLIGAHLSLIEAEWRLESGSDPFSKLEEAKAELSRAASIASLPRARLLTAMLELVLARTSTAATEGLPRAEQALDLLRGLEMSFSRLAPLPILISSAENTVAEIRLAKEPDARGISADGSSNLDAMLTVDALRRWTNLELARRDAIGAEIEIREDRDPSATLSRARFRLGQIRGPGRSAKERQLLEAKLALLEARWLMKRSRSADQAMDRAERLLAAVPSEHVLARRLRAERDWLASLSKAKSPNPPPPTDDVLMPFLSTRR